MSELDESVSENIQLAIDNTRGKLLEQLQSLSDGLKWLVENGVNGPRDGVILPNSVQYGVCSLLRHFRHDDAIEFLQCSSRVAIFIHHKCMDVVGNVIFPIDVVPGVMTGDQYYRFKECVRFQEYVNLTEQQFKDYANARIELIAKIIQEVQNLTITRRHVIW